MQILFICRANVFRSQLGEYFFNKYSKNHKAISGGFDFDQFNGLSLGEIFHIVPYAKKIMEHPEVGEDIFTQKSKKYTRDMIEEADRIIVILEDKKYIPSDLANSDKMIFWKIMDGVDSKGNIRSVEERYKIIYQIRDNVMELIEEIS